MVIVNTKTLALSNLISYNSFKVVFRGKRVNKKKRVNEMKEDSKVKVLMEQYNKDLKGIREGINTILGMKERVDGTFETVGDLSVKMTVVEKSISGVSSDIKVLKEDVKVLKEDVKELKADMKSVKGRLNKIESRLVSLEFDQSVAKDDYKDIKGHLISIEEELQEIKKLLKIKAEKEEVSHLEKRMILLENNLNA